jgi:hypothetical protein
MFSYAQTRVTAGRTEQGYVTVIPGEHMANRRLYTSMRMSSGHCKSKVLVDPSKCVCLASVRVRYAVYL